ncbi:hypothetical protein RirG_065600 [Rhizophagus irregularis DAOM 197198w]|uniref:Uncharacterized protein n=2 Tax=Rhizophagus irregularis TaxID=588596 RepID=A0A015JTB2_RHIIW|nr:hypothetical protein RirG_137680 [Rhizophagus irregularis DAOM 197198w]EXX70194.1 hypothetical protein RirG_089690 [Rhizophagus irregularis DAOM 197198w]EXX72831.1 hypothetical protein RirG_065600 [Rhizophagus irregularis DAOM 197198w]EXX72832.1 hypothetical protein RirG_065600 [Rhizophagus irregularis DAOM 197198w]EXX72833.1 hypothetical protein RirG_065600 [Rhizophagus irregularis DAOM 197198w]
MATVNEGLLRFGNWIIMYDLGASALTSSYGTHATAYRQVTDALTSNGFVMVQQTYIAIRLVARCCTLGGREFPR